MDAALPPRPWIRVVTMAAPTICETPSRLRALGVQIVSCIGGRALARSLFENRLVPVLLGRRETRENLRERTFRVDNPHIAPIIPTLRNQVINTQRAIRLPPLATPARLQWRNFPPPRRMAWSEQIAVHRNPRQHWS
jgi:hypothetical protein